jgi:hypothetical protein
MYTQDKQRALADVSDNAAMAKLRWIKDAFINSLAKRIIKNQTDQRFNETIDLARALRKDKRLCEEAERVQREQREKEQYERDRAEFAKRLMEFEGRERKLREKEADFEKRQTEKMDEVKRL